MFEFTERFKYRHPEIAAIEGTSQFVTNYQTCVTEPHSIFGGHRLPLQISRRLCGSE